MQPDDALKRKLAHLAREEGYAGPAFAPFLRALVFDYAVLTGVIALILWSADSVWLYALLPCAWVVIASRQHALLILMHECTHGVAHPSRVINDFLGEILCASPMAVSMATYRQAHLAHHRSPNTDDDPDWRRKLDDPAEAATWQFPQRSGAVLGFARLWWRSVTYLARSLGENSAAGNTSHSPVPGLKAMRLVLYATVALLLTAFGGWLWFVLLWLVPLVLVLPLIMRFRSIAEHFALAHTSVYDGSRTVIAGGLERFLLAPHGINFHLEHHLVASVPFSRLHALHERFMTNEQYRRQAHVNLGYLTGQRPLLRELFAPT